MKNKNDMDLFKLNDRIDLLSKEEDKTVGLIYDMKDGKILVSISADDEDFKLMEIGESVRGAVACRNEIITFDANITGKMFKNASIYELSDMKNFKKIQRREDVRVRFTKEVFFVDNEKMLQVDMKGPNLDEVFEKLKEHLKEGLMLDLSAGGLKVSTRQNIDQGKKLIFLLDFIDEKMLVKGKVVHKEINLVPKKTMYIYGIKFVDIRDQDKEKIIKHLFVIMRKNRIR